MRYVLLLFIVFLTTQTWAAEIQISQITEAIEQASPGSKYQYYQFRARAYSKKNLPELALSDLTASINLNPTIMAYRERTDILMKMGRYQEALNDINTILKTDAGNPDIYRLRSKAYYEVKQYKEAVNDARRVLAKIPNDSTSLQILMESTSALTPVEDIVIGPKGGTKRYSSNGRATKRGAIKTPKLAKRRLTSFTKKKTKPQKKKTKPQNKTVKRKS